MSAECPSDDEEYQEETSLALPDASTSIDKLSIRESTEVHVGNKVVYKNNIVLPSNAGRIEFGIGGTNFSLFLDNLEVPRLSIQSREGATEVVSNGTVLAIAGSETTGDSASGSKSSEESVIILEEETIFYDQTVTDPNKEDSADDTITLKRAITYHSSEEEHNSCTELVPADAASNVAVETVQASEQWWRNVFPFSETGTHTTIQFNDLVDSLLRDVRNQTCDDNEGVPLPELNCPFHKRVKLFGKAFINADGAFRATRGRALGLLNLHRAGDVIASTDDNHLALGAHICLPLLEAVYDRYTLDFLSVRSEGSMRAVIESCEISLAVKTSHVGRLDLTHVCIRDINDIRFSFDGPGVLNQLAGILVNPLTKHFKTVILDILNRRLCSVLTKKLGEVDLLEKLTFDSSGSEDESD